MRLYKINFNYIIIIIYNSDLNECQTKSGICQNGGTCKNNAGSFMCHCAEGYTGKHCETEVSSILFIIMTLIIFNYYTSTFVIIKYTYINYRQSIYLIYLYYINYISCKYNFIKYYIQSYPNIYVWFLNI